MLPLNCGPFAGEVEVEDVRLYRGCRTAFDGKMHVTKGNSCFQRRFLIVSWWPMRLSCFVIFDFLGLWKHENCALITSIGPLCVVGCWTPALVVDPCLADCLNCCAVYAATRQRRRREDSASETAWHTAGVLVLVKD